MTNQNLHTVAIIEDNSALGAGLQRIIESTADLRCVGVWPNGEEGVRKVDAFRPDVVLMDINLPGISGIEAAAVIKEQLPEIQIIMVTVYGDHDKIFAALQAGASGYLLKSSSPQEVRDAIHGVLSGGAPMSAEIARRVVEAFHRPSRTTAESNLTPREKEVLGFVADGMTDKEIANELGISALTVGTHLKRSYEKLHLRSRVEAAIWYRDTRGAGDLPPKK